MEAISPLSTEECDINTLNTDGESFLHIACKNGHLNCVKTLEIFYRYIDFENTKDAKNSFGDTALHLACYGKSINIVRLLIEMRCSTNIPNKKGETAQDIPLNEDGDCLLHIACQWGDVSIVRYLIADQRCNPNVQSSTSENIPLHTACYGKNLSIIRFFLKQKCSTIIPNKKGGTAQDIPLNEDGDCLLHIACQWGDVDIVRYLITDERCNPSIQSSTSKNTPLHIAAKCGQEDTIDQLFSCKECNPNAQNKDGDTPLHFAVRQSKTAAISKLLAHQQCSINVQNNDGDTPLHIAAKYGQVDTIDQLLSYNECNPNVENKDGDTPLHIAVGHNKTSVISKLLAHQQCSINVQNNVGDTPLHIAAKYGQGDAIDQLFSYKECDPNAQNKDGDTPLHFAVRHNKKAAISILLAHQQCSINVQNNDGDTPLHIAAKFGQEDTIDQLFLYKECDPNAQNKEGDTPLHTATKYEQVNTIAKLLSYKECDPNAQNKEGDTPLHIAVRRNKRSAISHFEGDNPLHIACYRKSLDIIKLLLAKKCSTIIPNKKGETAQDIPLNEDGDCLLHIACQWGDVDIVKYLITNERCNPSVQSSTSENTPLHIAAKYGQEKTVVQLLSCKECNPNAQNKDGDAPLHITVRHNKTAAISHLLDNKQCNPNVQNKDGNTPLHIAVRNNNIPAVSQLLTSKECNLNVMNEDHLTPLLIAIKHDNCTMATAVLQHKDCDTSLCDPYGNTALHLACIGGETQPEMVEVAKQLLISVDVDPSCVNNAGQTPIELTTNYQLIQAISHMVECKTKQSVQTYINMFIVGNPETGKSTLVKAICKEATSILWKIVPKLVRRVKNVPLHTAGIIPTTFRSKTFGNTILYDLAGQVEYYTSHAAVIRSTVISTPPAFIVVVNLSESEEKISQTLRYWWSFIDNHAARSSAPPKVILVGSHADVVKSTGKSVKLKVTQITDILKKLPASFHFAGHVALDCRDPASKELQHFCSLVNKSCTALRETADVDLRCHVLYAFLLERFKDQVACTVSDVATSIKESSALLPQKLDSLLPLISTLSGKGLLLLVKGGESHGDWWIILQKQALLGEINGVIFAPKDFSEHKDLSWSTGIVPFSKLRNEFLDYNPNMVTEFLIHLEFCFIIEDPKTLSLLKDKAEDTSDVSEDYYFFPALISVKNPFDVWEQNDAMCCKCGWLYQCVQPDQFLTTQFLHVLILHLAFTFALKLDPGDSRQDSLALRRKCSVWKHGIGWRNLVQIETVVEVGLQCQSVIVMMRCPKGKEAECVQLRSGVIQKVLEAKDEHCKVVEMSESFIHPTDVNYPFTDKFKDYSLTGIARVIIEGTTDALDRTLKNPIPLKDLLLFDTYTSTGLLRELFNEKHSMDEEMRSQVLEALDSEYIENCAILHMFHHACFLHLA